MIQDKKEFIDRLDKLELSHLYERLLPSMGFAEVSKLSSDSLQGKVSVQNMGVFTNCYIFFSEPLSRGYNQYESLVDSLNKRFDAGCSKIFIVTNKNISNGFQEELERRMSKKNSIEFNQNSAFEYRVPLGPGSFILAGIFVFLGFYYWELSIT